MSKETYTTSIINRMAVILLSFGFCSFIGSSQNTISERLSHVLKVQDMDLGIKLYNEISAVNLKQLPDSSLFNYHYLGGYLNSEIPNHEKAITHLLEAKRLCETSLGTYSIGYMEIINGLGNEYIELGQYDDALAIFQEGIVKSMAIRNSATHAFGHLIVGLQNCYEYKGWLNEIPALSSDAWNLWPKDEEPLATYNYFPLWLLEQFYRRYGFYDKALDVSDTILNFITEKAGSAHPEIADALYRRGNILSEMGNNNDAVETYKLGLSILKTNNKESEKMYGLLASNLLMAINSTDRREECDNILQDIKNFGKKTNDLKIYKKALFSAADFFNKKGNFEKALSLNAELTIQDLSNDERTVISNQANTINFNREVIEALPYLEDLFSNALTADEEWFGAGYRLSSAYYLRGETDKSIAVLKKMHDAILANKDSGQDYYFWILASLYDASLDNGAYQDALRYSDEQLDYLSSASNVSESCLLAVLNNVAVAKIKSNKLDGIDENMSNIEDYTTRLFGKESQEYSIYLHNRGRAYQLQGKLNEAKTFYISAINLQHKISGNVLTRTVQYLQETENRLTDEELDL